MKKFFNKFLAIALLGAMVTFVGCKDYQGDIDDINGRIEKLQGQVDEINKLINSGAVITDVTSIDGGVKVTLSDGESFEIMNGKDGADGANGTNGTNGTDGEDGSVVEIGDNGNWYIDGEDTGLAAKGENGKDGVDGNDGVDGEDGVDGVNGDYYMPNVETGNFDKYTWDAEAGEYTKEATDISFLAPGTITAVLEEDGTVTLYNVEGAEGAITLGQVRVTSLLVSEQAGHGFVFERDNNMPIMSTRYVAGADGATVLSSTEEFNYIVNPANATAPASWDIMFQNVELVRANSPIAVLKDANYVMADGLVTVSGKFDASYFANLNQNSETQARFYLQANDKQQGAVKSNNAVLESTEVEAFVGNNNNVERVCDEADLSDAKWRFYKDEPLKSDKANYSVVYDNAEGIDLSEYVFGLGLDGTEYACLSSMGIKGYTFEYELPESYLGSDVNTNQQAFVTLNGSTLVVNYDKFGTSAINRTPIVKVNMMGDAAFGAEEVVIASAYIKLQITETPINVENLVVVADAQQFEYADLFAGEYKEYPTGTYGTDIEIEMDWLTMNTQVYKPLGMTHEEFIEYYELPTGASRVYNTEVPAVAVGNYAVSTDTNTDTPTVAYAINLYAENEIGIDTAVIVLTPKSQYAGLLGDVTIKQPFEIIAPAEAMPEFNPYFTEVVNGVMSQENMGRVPASGTTGWEFAIAPAEAFIGALAGSSDYYKEAAVFNTKYANTLRFNINMDLPEFDAKRDSVALSATAGYLYELNGKSLEMIETLSNPELVVPMEYVMTYLNGYEQVLTWNIIIKNPLSLTMGNLTVASQDGVNKSGAMMANPTFNKIGDEATMASKYGVQTPVYEVLDMVQNLNGNLVFDDVDKMFSWTTLGSTVVNDIPNAATYTATVVAIADGATKPYASATATGSLTILETK